MSVLQLRRPWPYIVALLLVALVAVVGNRHHASTPATNTTPSGTTANTSKTGPAVSPIASGFNKKQYSTDDPSSIWVVVNKSRPLNPKTYAPDITVPNVSLRLSAADGEMHVSRIMAPAMEAMFAGAKQAGLSLMLASGYRSYNLQVSVYGSEVSNYGQAQADNESARPGYSEHQTGLAADIEPASHQCEVADCFGATPEGKWLAANAYTYGFIVRYTASKQAITGYRPEPWHVRYVGKSLAKEMHDTGIQTLEEFFGLPAASDYKQ